MPAIMMSFRALRCSNSQNALANKNAEAFYGAKVQNIITETF